MNIRHHPGKSGGSLKHATGKMKMMYMESHLQLSETIRNNPKGSPVHCDICGGQVESQPMKERVCYDCYRNITSDLGTRMIVSGGEVIELDAQTSTKEIPF